jgi:hypothetical protein
VTDGAFSAALAQPLDPSMNPNHVFTIGEYRQKVAWEHQKKLRLTN